MYIVNIEDSAQGVAGGKFDAAETLEWVVVVRTAGKLG